VEGGGVGGFVDRVHHQPAEVGSRGGTDLDVEGAGVAAVLVAAREGGAGKAGGDVLYVNERPPHLLDRCGDIKGLL
jgi:hypothetical protein